MPDAVHDTFTIEREYPRSPNRVFAFLSTAEKKRRWYIDDVNTTVESYDMDFRVGGWERTRYSFQKGTPVDGKPFANEVVFLDIVPDQRVVMAQTMDIDGRRISVSLITCDLAPVGTGTRLTFTHQAVFFEGADGPTMRRQGWVGLLDRIGREVLEG